ncbi:ABC transporter substrate-binding protein [Oleidesulfovibrio sp.]|uniref:ABC transporter substrate-binding protein n=1 Tax=Oleidesulfovibrio sp. TaxID=2909707 RepID=UPI003A8AE944
MLAVVILITAAALLSGCNLQQGTEDSQQRAGISDTEIRFGSSLPLTGHASYLGIQTMRGALSYINYINENGGVYGRKIVLDARDDGYDPPRCLANTQALLIEGDVFGLFCYVGTPTTVRVLPLIEEARVPLLGMFTGANRLRKPFSRYVINVRASYYQETEAAVRHLVEDMGLTRIAVFYQYDDYGFDGLTGTELALRELGLAPVARGSYQRGTMDVKDGLQRILAADPQAVVVIGTYEPSARFIRMAGDAGISAVFHTLSFVGAEELARLLEGESRNPVTMSQVVPPPLAPQTPDLMADAKQYVQLMQRYFPQDTPSIIGLEGYVNARVLVEALKKAGPELTRESFIDAVESLHGFSLGGRSTVSFSAKDHQGMDQVYFTLLCNGEFVLIKDFAPVKELMPPLRQDCSKEFSTDAPSNGTADKPLLLPEPTPPDLKPETKVPVGHKTGSPLPAADNAGKEAAI